MGQTFLSAGEYLADKNVCPAAIAPIRPSEKAVRLLHIARFEAAAEPADALGAGAMGERVGDDVAWDRACRRSSPMAVAAARRLDIACFQNVLMWVGMIGPDAGQIIGLQFQSTDAGSLPACPLAARSLNLVAPAEQVLHVMADLMGNHIRLRKIARRVKAVIELAEEFGVEIDPFDPLGNKTGPSPTGQSHKPTASRRKTAPDADRDSGDPSG